MFKQWFEHLTDCTVVKVGKYFVYPIHRVGHTSLMSVAEKKYVNKEIAKLSRIDVLWREPKARFVSGVNEYSKHRKIKVAETYDQIKNCTSIPPNYSVYTINS